MRTLHELIDTEEPALSLLEQWAEQADLPVEILPPAENRGDVLVELQVSTHSVLGAMVYETGGVLVDGGWLRMLGSGHPRLPRSITAWNAGKTDRFFLVADDVVGGFFALNGGAFGSDLGNVYYLAPDTLEWEALEIGYAAFTQWAFTKNLHSFYDSMRWAGWQQEVCVLPGDQCFNFYPFLYTEQGSTQSSSRRAISIAEQYAFNTGVDRSS
ncbi:MULTISPECIES: DUF2625 domain-containing protein [Comamonas]|uniref:DUF2625 domain-containing protein n=1 Tax=Comamonas sediminis TaxID=1783360 RepID=A0ABV4B1F0_9BURK|nr:DUF2625 domain-containing protein [Comamonas sp.]